MKWISQHIWDFISRFRNDVYMEDLAEVEHEFSVMVGPDGKLTKSTHPGERSRIQIRNDEGATIPAGAPIYSKGEIGGSERIKVGICDSSDPAKMPCIGIVETELNTTDNKDGFATTQGVYNTNISGFTGLSEGDILYVNGGSAPHLTQTKPTNGDLIQNVGVVIKTNGTTCQGLLIAAIGRTNDVPWPLYVDHANQRVGIGIASPTEELHVVGDALVTGDVTIEGNLSISNSVSQTISFGDNDFLYLGDSNDLYLRHDGSNTTIYNSTGHLGIYNAADDKDIVFYCDDGSGGVTTYLTLDGGLGFIVADKKIRYKDNVEATFGDSGDARIYHTGSSTLFDNFTGNLAFTQNADDGDIIFNCDDGSGGTTAYITLDGSLGHTTVSKRIRFNDSVDSTFGAGNDLRLQHDGSQSYITNYTGNLYIDQATDDGDLILQCDNGSGGLTPYITLDGSAKQTVFEENVRFLDNIELRLGSGSDIKMFHLSNQGYIQNQTGHLNIQQYADDSDIIFSSDDGSGGVTEYFRLNGGFSSPYTNFPDNSTLSFGGSNDLRIYHDGTNNNINSVNGHLKIAQYSDDSDIIFYSDDGSGGLAEYFRLDGSQKKADFFVPVSFGASGGSAGHDVTFFGATNGFDMFWDTSQNALRLDDGVNIYIGSGSDLKINHDGNHSYISQEGTGSLFIRNTTDDKDIIFQSDDGSGGLATYMTVDGSNSRIQFDANLYVADGIQLRLGTGNDLRLYHSTNSYVSNEGSGDLYIRNLADDKDIIFQSDDGSGGVETYFFLDGSASSGNPYTIFPDNSHLGFGSGYGDLQLHHDGTDSYIKNRSTGRLIIQQDVDDNDIIFNCDDGSGGVATYITIDGDNTLTEFSKGAQFASGSYVKLLDGIVAYFGTGNDLRVWHSGSDSFISHEGDGDLYIRNLKDDKDILFQCDDGSGGTGLYFYLDGSAAKTIFSKNTEHQDSIKGQFGDSGDFSLFHNGTNSYIENDTGDLYIRNNVDDKDIIFQSDDGSGGVTTYMQLDGSHKRVIFPNDVQAAFGTSSRMVIVHDGTNATIRETQGDLQIVNTADDKDIIFQSDDGSGSTQTYMTIDGSDADVKVHTNIELERALTLQHASDPGDPASGHSVIWSDTSGNLKIKINVAGTTVTKTITTYE